MVAAQDEKVLGILDLVGEEQADGLQRLLATIDVVTEEEVVGLWWEAAVLEQAQQIVVLSVDVAADLPLVNFLLLWIVWLLHKPLSALPARAVWVAR